MTTGLEIIFILFYLFSLDGSAVLLAVGLFGDLHTGYHFSMDLG